MFLKWLKEAFDKLPGTDDALFHNLWGNSRFLFEGKHGIGDVVDCYSARLTAATLRHGGILLLTLPDFQPHRPAFLFATALIRHYLDSRTHAVNQNNTVLYFGSSIGIRDQLRRTSIQGLGVDLAHVFSQEDIHCGVTTAGISPLPQHTSFLPHVITVYSPTDPIEILNIHRPPWIAIDCSDAPSIDWLQPLLKECALQRIPVLAWGQNPFSTSVNEFGSLGQPFTWPHSSPSILRGEMESLLQSKDSISIEPFVICGKSSRSLSASLAEADVLLSKATQRAASSGRLITDTVAVHWKYLRSLESLPVPIDFYEAEASKFWGLQAFRTLEAVCTRFRSSCMQSVHDVYHDLESAAVLLQQAKNNIETVGCALWEALINICLEDLESDSDRLLVFPNNNRKQLFLFAMLARHNTTEEDLAEMGKRVTSLAELRREARLIPTEKASWHPILVGLPSHATTPRILYALLYPNVDILLYPHQRSLFMRQQADWSVRMSGDIKRSMNTLSYLTSISEPPMIPVSHRIKITVPFEMDVETTRKTKTAMSGPYWNPNDTVIEVDRLFQSNSIDFDGEELNLSDQIETDDGKEREAHEDVWCTEAIRIQFDQGWCADFAPTNKINVISQGKHESRYVRSLRIEDQVLVIHGQKRQNLYDLIISRVHRHPSIELHLVMIRRWQADLRLAYVHWCSCTADDNELRAYGKRDLYGLLRRMQSNGSALMTHLALRFWLKGLVLCPDEPEDLRRVAEILNMEFVQNNYKHISRAAIRLRGLHRGLSIKLNNWLQNQATGVMQQTDDDIIDADLGLTFGDIRSSLLILRVKDIENVTGPFLMSTLGQIERKV